MDAYKDVRVCGVVEGTQAQCVAFAMVRRLVEVSYLVRAAGNPPRCMGSNSKCGRHSEEKRVHVAVVHHDPPDVIMAMYFALFTF